MTLGLKIVMLVFLVNFETYFLIYSFLNLFFFFFFFFSFNMYVKHFYHEPLARETWATTPRVLDVK